MVRHLRYAAIRCDIAWIACALLLLQWHHAFGQSPAGVIDDRSQSDIGALETVQRAISAMGGSAAWNSIGAASTTVVISTTGAVDRHAVWSDDWASGHNRSRRDSTDATAKASTVATGNYRKLRLGNGAIRKLPASSDVTVLAVGYPGAALTISLKRADCVFTQQTEASPSNYSGQPVITERCHEPLYPNSHVELKWTFSEQTGLPASVTIPVIDLLYRLEMSEQVAFTSFQTDRGRVYSATIRITRPSGRVDTLQIAPASFTTSLPDSTFDFTR